MFESGPHASNFRTQICIFGAGLFMTGKELSNGENVKILKSGNLGRVMIGHNLKWYDIKEYQILIH